MPDTPPSPDPTTDPAPPPPPPAAPDVQPAPDPAQLGDPGKAALKAERVARGAAEKRATEAEARLREIEDAQKSDLQRATDRAAELERQLADSMKQSLRLRIATEHSIGADDLVLLTGGTEEELQAQAARIAALNAAQQAAAKLPAFAASPAQAAGNATPPPPERSVNAGREMFRARRGK